MSEQFEKWDRQWSELLTRCHGPEVEAAATFKSRLLQDLKKKVADTAVTTPAESLEADAENWRKLLTATYVPCEPSEEFKSRLFGHLKTKQAQAMTTQPAAQAEEEEVLKSLLISAYTPVMPRREFETRLFENLKERQRVTSMMRRTSRRRTIFMSGVSSLAAAAVVMFAVWAMPLGNLVPSQVPASPAIDLAMLESIPDINATKSPSPATEAERALAGSVIPAAAGLALASAGSYRVSDAFNEPALPTTARGINMEVNDGDGWKTMDETLFAQVKPGMAFRTASNKAGSIGFGDGSSIAMHPDTLIQATDKGIAPSQGFMSVNVPASSENRFRLHFPERDIAVEPGTVLAAMVESPAGYAEGGAPAPMVMVDDGGLAVAKGKNGSGPLFANYVYRLDNYVSPDLPGRPACSNELKVFEENNQSKSMTSFVSGNGIDLGRPSTAPSTKGFTKKDTRWLANNYDGQQPTVRIKYLSDDYFGFVNAHRDLAPSLALGSDVVIDGRDGNFYEIYK